MKVRLDSIRKYMKMNNIDNNLETEHQIKFLGMYKIDKTDGKKWIISIKINENSNCMFRNGYFKITIEFPDNFPQKRPECQIINKIYHLNISPRNGHISAVFLNSWDSSTTISELLVGLYLVFISEQNPLSPYSGDMAREYETKYNEFIRKAREWVIKFALPSSEDIYLAKKAFDINDNKEDEINELKDKLNKANKIIETQKMEIQNLTNQINSFKNFEELINNFKTDIKNRDDKIYQLLQKLQNNNKLNNNININIPKKQIDVEDMKCVTFISTDQSLVYGISCSGKDVFAEVEERLNKEYPEYRETNNSFLSNGKEVLRFKTINDNKIGSGKPIMLIKPS